MTQALHGFDPNCILLQFGPVSFSYIRITGERHWREKSTEWKHKTSNRTKK